MNHAVMGLKLSDSAVSGIEARMAFLEMEGVTVSEAVSGEMNFSGCKKGYCQAWD